MGFVFSQEHLSILQWIMRDIIAFFFMLFVARLMGQRTISQLRILDLIIALIIGSVVSHPLADAKAGLTNALLSISVLVLLYLLGVLCALKSSSFRKLVNGTPTTLVQNGEILFSGLKKARISVDILLEELREKKVEDIRKVALAIWETNGKISVFLLPEYEPATPSLMKLQTPPFVMPKAVIKDGQIDPCILEQTGRDQVWLATTLQTTHHAKTSDVLLATIDANGILSVFLYK